MSAAVIPTRWVPPARAGVVATLATRAIAAAPTSTWRMASLLFLGTGFLLLVEMELCRRSPDQRSGARSGKPVAAS